MSKIPFLILFLGFNLVADSQVFHPKIQSKLDGIQSSTSLVKTFQGFGIKTPGSASSDTAQQWIIEHLIGSGFADIILDTFTRNSVFYTNIITSKKSTVSDEYIIVCGHYDTRNGPGASDNGSGVVALLQTARVIQDLNTTRSVVFVFFDGEEGGFIGSESYVSRNLSAKDSNLYMVFNIDQIGGTLGEPGNEKIKCERDENLDPIENNGPSWLITDTVAKLATIYTNLEPVITKAYASDYVPFEKEGYVIAGLYQNATDKHSHSAADTIENLDTTSMNQAIRLAAATTMYFAQIENINSVAKSDVLYSTKVYPNPGRSYLYFESQNIIERIVIRDSYGRIVSSKTENRSKGRFELDHRLHGLYFIELYALDTAFVSTHKINFVIH